MADVPRLCDETTDCALTLAEDLLMSAPNYSDDVRLVHADDLLHLVQMLTKETTDA